MWTSKTQYALTGFLLGLGAPAGALLLRLGLASEPLSTLWAQEWHAAQFYYVYMAIGTTLAFSLFGYMLGRRQEELRELSKTDGLTGLSNHRTLQQDLSKEILRTDRYHTPLTCMMLDIDNFKQVNDRYGHLFGDQVLAHVARLIRELVRETDTVGRYGGEEFLVIMPQTPVSAALPLADRIVQTIAEYPFQTDNKDPVQITVSLGLAMYPDAEGGVKTKNALLSAADQAMYRAKCSGKNQSVAWRP